MKKLLSVLLALSMCFALTACGSSDISETAGTTQPTVPEESSVETEKTETPDAAQSTGESSSPDSNEAQQAENFEQNGISILVAYFSRTGENYNVGTIEKGNTHIVADMIAQQVDADIFEISTVTPYPESYDECTEIARQEQSENARPALTASVDNMQDYDVIFLGYPIWWGDMPMAVYTFLESYDFSGKTIVPFATHEGSGLASSPEVTEITMTVGGTVITAELTDSETTRAFLDTLPRSLTMNRYGDRECYGRINALSENGELIPDFENGDVTYYPAGPSFAIFFAGEDSSSQGGLIRIGKITSDLSVFDTLPDTAEIYIEVQE